ncbi:MAG: hypothetical protein M3O15_05450 [Acidobacteriota bacterium]|nr:hypothetical protein [Acidobacteriota bacterium]
MKKTRQRLTQNRETLRRLEPNALLGAQGQAVELGPVQPVQFYTQPKGCYSPLCVPTMVETQCC